MSGKSTKSKNRTHASAVHTALQAADTEVKKSAAPEKAEAASKETETAAEQPSLFKRGLFGFPFGMRKEQKSGQQKINIERETLRYAFFALMGLILFAWALINMASLFGFLKKVVSLFAAFLGGCGTAYVINAVMDPIEKLWLRIFKKNGKISRKLKRPVCMILSTLLILGLIFAVVFMMIPGIRDTVSTFVDGIPTYVNRLSVWWGNVVDFAARYKVTLPEYGIDSQALIEKVQNFLENSGNGIISATVGATSSILSGAINSLLAFVFSMYLLGRKESIGAHLKRSLYALADEKKADRVMDILSLSNRTFSGFISGQFIEAIIIGVLCFIGMEILRLPYAGVISILIGFTALVPIIGAWLGAIVGAFLILLVNPLKAVWFVIFLLILQQLEGNLIYPKVVGRSVGLPGILVLLSVTVGGDAFGFLGMLLGVPVCAVLYTLYEEFIEKKIREKAELKAAEAASEAQKED